MNTSSPLLLSNMVPNNPSKLNAMVSIFFGFCFLSSRSVSVVCGSWLWACELNFNIQEESPTRASSQQTPATSKQQTTNNKRNKQRSKVVYLCSGCESESIARPKSSRNHATPKYRAAIIMASFHPNASPVTSCKCMGTYEIICAINEASW